jgi:NhaP-type Na+/H+ and K+/H+ antiporter
LTDLPRLQLEASVLLSMAVLVSLFTRRLHIPLTVVLAASGMLVTSSAWIWRYFGLWLSVIVSQTLFLSSTSAWSSVSDSRA